MFARAKSKQMQWNANEIFIYYIASTDVLIAYINFYYYYVRLCFRHQHGIFAPPPKTKSVSIFFLLRIGTEFLINIPFEFSFMAAMVVRT